MHKFLVILTVVLAVVWPGPALQAENTEPCECENAEEQAVVARAMELKKILDRLLTQSNHSSIQKVLEHGSASNEPIIAEALRLKASGEKYLENQDYIKAAMTLQSALDRVFLAIRSDDDYDAAKDALSERLSQEKSTNDTFISAATRVLGSEKKGEAGEVLEMALSARQHADEAAASGDVEQALEELLRSTDLAQQAIKTVRNGMVIERGR